jgi:hypothetical protein
LFVENLPFFGKEPRLFFIPESSEEANELRHMIEQQGGFLLFTFLKDAASKSLRKRSLTYNYFKKDTNQIRMAFQIKKIGMPTTHC